MANRVGQQLGNYKLEKLLGEGGFAEVYLGEHIALKQKRAIKVLRTALTEQEGLSFRVEAQRLASLTHPHIIPILDFDEREGFPYLVMSYAPNGSLRDRHPKGTRIPLPTVIDYVKQISSALQYIHNQKLIHRDVKPENMLLGSDNTILLSDVGIAVVAHSEYSQRTQIATGTPYYMAPEQFRGKAEPSSDQYSLGIIVYEWLSGITPFFEGDSLQLGFQHAFEPPPPLREKLSTIPVDIEKVVMTALAKKPQERFMSVQVFADALENAIQGNLTTQRPHSAPLSSPLPPSPPPQPMPIRNAAPLIPVPPQNPAYHMPPRQVLPTPPFKREKLWWIPALLIVVFGLCLMLANAMFPSVLHPPSNPAQGETNVTPTATQRPTLVSVAVKPSTTQLTFNIPSAWSGVLNGCGGVAVCDVKLTIQILGNDGKFIGLWSADLHDGAGFSNTAYITGDINGSLITWNWGEQTTGNIVQNGHWSGVFSGGISTISGNPPGTFIIRQI